MEYKYNVGDLVIETCFLNVEDYQLYLVVEVDNEKEILTMQHKDGSKYFYSFSEVERWIERNNAKHIPVKKG
jgi:hypothetical protein